MAKPDAEQQKKQAGDKPTIPYWHVWTDEHGESHQTQCCLTHFKLEGISGDAEPQWQNIIVDNSNATINFSVLPVGWIGEWHENPKPQWIIPLSGRWFVETMDGTRVEMGPGEISFGEDQNTRADPGGHKGHLSGTVGDVPCAMMIVQLHETPTQAAACHFK